MADNHISTTVNSHGHSAGSLPKPAMGRQIKACNSCRILKIKCVMDEEGGTFRRCRHRGINCQVEKSSSAAVFEESNRWRNDISGRVQQLQTAVDVLLRMSELPPLNSYNHTATPALSEARHNQSDSRRSGNGSEDGNAQENEVGAAATIDTDIYSLPINSLFEVTRLPPLGTTAKSPSSQRNIMMHDFIARGLIQEHFAERLFDLFVTRLDYFCYGLMCPFQSLQNVRANSTVLTAAVCAVSALHHPEGSAAFKTCRVEYERLVATNMFAASHSADDIRAFIIGSYWLADMSYTLLGHAIRVAMGLNYHLAYYSVMKDSSGEDVEKARLWYVLYILDHHSSILNGRPALISASEEPHQQWELFIRANGNQEPDLRMSSQTALYHIISKVKDVFGGHARQTAPDLSLQQLRTYFSELDRWYMVWGDRMPRNAYVGWFPRDGAILHYHFARLHLCSYIFRGLSVESVAASSSQVKDCANLAVTSASAVLELVMTRDDLRTALVGMPIYFHAMTTFAAVFLIKAASTGFPGPAAIDHSTASVLIENFVRELRAQKAARQHLVFQLSNGLEELMKALSSTTSEDPVPLGPEGAFYDSSIPFSTMDSMFMVDPFDIFQYPTDTSPMTDF